MESLTYSQSLQDRFTAALVAEYRYNGLNQRITAHYDTDLDLDVDGSDTVHHFTYDSRWRTVARFEGSDTEPATAARRTSLGRAP